MIDTLRLRRDAMVLASVALIAAACERPDPDGNAAGPAFRTRDSAGVTIAENTVIAPKGIATWTVDTAPALTIGVSAGDSAYEFARVGGVHQLPNGMIVVLNGRGEAAYELRFFDSTGKHIVTHGRRGQGPGEYQWINFFGPAGGDTVIGVDFPAQRINWVSASRGFVRSSRLVETQFRKLLGDDAFGFIETMVPLGDSVFAGMAYRPIPGVESGSQRRETFHIVNLVSGKALELLRYDEPARKVLRLASGPTSLTPMAAGSAMHVVDRERRRICAAITRTTEISCIDSAGKRLLIRWRADDVPYTDADRRAYEDRIRQARGGRGRMSETDLNTMLAAIDWPKRQLLFSALRLDTDGNFWILERTSDVLAAENGSRFRILDPDGRQIAFATPFPVRAVGLGDALHIADSTVLRVFADPDGAPVIGVFRIRKPE